jgi:hypothetical protein
MILRTYAATLPSLRPVEKASPNSLIAITTEGRDPGASMCFVWYLLAEDEATKQDA